MFKVSCFTFKVSGWLIGWNFEPGTLNLEHSYSRITCTVIPPSVVVIGYCDVVYGSV